MKHNDTGKKKGLFDENIIFRISCSALIYFSDTKNISWRELENKGLTSFCSAKNACAVETTFIIWPEQ